MKLKSKIEELYRIFDAQFSPPSAFENAGCCVSVEAEQELLAVPRSDLSGKTLGTLTHYLGSGSCFGTFEQYAYFLPRVLEVFAIEEGGSCISLSSALKADKARYIQLNLWQPIIEIFLEFFSTATEEFKVIHFNRAQCQEKGWTLDHFDCVPCGDTVDGLLTEVFYPEFSPDAARWKSFFLEWAEADNPDRVANLLDLLKRRWKGTGPKMFVPDSISNDDFVEFVRSERNKQGLDVDALCDWWAERAINYNLPFPRTFELHLANDEFIQNLIKRAEPAISNAGSPTWMEDLLSVIAEKRQTESHPPVC